MKSNDIATVYVTFTGSQGGKRRPVVIVDDNAKEVSFFSITSQYGTKSKRIKKVYFPIRDWQQAGLKKESWIDAGSLKAIPKNKGNVTYRKIGRLSIADMRNLNAFLEDLQSNGII